MTNEEIKKAKQELFVILLNTESDRQVSSITVLAKRVCAPLPAQRGQGGVEYVNQVARNIHITLQTETMINTCEVSKQSCSLARKSCFWAAAAATLALFCTVATWVTVYVSILAMKG